MGKRVYRAEGLPQIKRQTARTYAYVVVGEHNIAHWRDAWTAESAAKYARSNWAYLSRAENDNSKRALAELNAEGVFSEEDYLRRENARRGANIEKLAAKGTIALAWCGNLRLASTQAKRLSGMVAYTNVRIVPVVE